MASPTSSYKTTQILKSVIDMYSDLCYLKISLRLVLKSTHSRSLTYYTQVWVELCGVFQEDILSARV